MKKKRLLLTLTLILTLASVFCVLSFASDADGENYPTVSIDKFNLVFEDNVYLKYAVKFDGVEDSALSSSTIGMLYFTEPQESYVSGKEEYFSSVVGYTKIDGGIRYRRGVKARHSYSQHV